MENTEAVLLTYRSADLQPPLYVAGSFTEPPWVPQEMACHQIASGERIFTKEIHVQSGATVQYKFRVGLGDWWVLDEAAPTVADDMGNQNNLLEVANRTSAMPDVLLTPPQSPPVLDTSAKASAVEKQQQSPLASSPPYLDASTPSFVRTTIEVASTAAGVDQEAPEPEIPGALAGRLGVRRLSSTPIVEVADTAAEVADTAEVLDAPSAQVTIGLEFPYECLADRDSEHDVAPLFAYEYAGGYDKSSSENGSEFLPEPHPVREWHTKSPTFNPKDPTLERFPSSCQEIYERVRAIEAGLEVDRTSFTAVSPSPVISPGCKGSVDLAGDLGISPTSSTRHSPPSWHSPPNRLPELHKGSSSRDSNSIVDVTPPLNCIMEETGQPEMAKQPSNISTGCRKVPQTTGVKPTIVASKANGMSKGVGDWGALKSSQNGIPAIFSPRVEGADGVGPLRSRTPVSGHSVTTVDANKNGNWFTAFFRLLFVNWLGGLLGKLGLWRKS